MVWFFAQPATIHKLDKFINWIKMTYFVKIKCTTLGNVISISYYKHIKLQTILFSDFGANFFHKFEFLNIFGKLPQNCVR